MFHSQPESETKHDLRRSIAEKTGRIGVLGLGHVGLPIAQAWLEAGYVVWGFDTDDRRCALLQNGQCPLDRVPKDWIAHGRADDRFHPSNDFSQLSSPW